MNLQPIYVVPSNATVDVLSSIQLCFGLVSKRWFLRHVQCFGVNYWIWRKDCTLASMFHEALFIQSIDSLMKATREEDDRRIWIKYYVFLFQIFLCVIQECTVTRFNISPPPFETKKKSRRVATLFHLGFLPFLVYFGAPLLMVTKLFTSRATRAIHPLISIHLWLLQDDSKNVLRARESGKGVLTAPFKLLNNHIGVIFTFAVYKYELPQNARPQERIQAAIG